MRACVRACGGLGGFGPNWRNPAPPTRLDSQSCCHERVLRAVAAAGVAVVVAVAVKVAVAAFVFVVPRTWLPLPTPRWPAEDMRAMHTQGSCPPPGHPQPRPGCRRCTRRRQRCAQPDRGTSAGPLLQRMCHVAPPPCAAQRRVRRVSLHQTRMAGGLVVESTWQVSLSMAWQRSAGAWLHNVPRGGALRASRSGAAEVSKEREGTEQRSTC